MARSHQLHHLLTRQVPTVRENAKVADLEKLLLSHVGKFKTINYIYILDAERRLSGVISIRELFRARKNTLVKTLSPRKIITANLHTPPEQIAFLALKNSLKAIPVLDKNKKFLGVVGHKQLLAILDSAAVENLLRFGGVMYSANKDDIFKLSISKSLKHRLPWLVVGLLGGVLASDIVSNFESTLEKNLILAAFIPLIVYIADAVGTQMEAFIIRDLSLRQDFNFIKYFFRQAFIVMILSAILAGLFYTGGLVFYHNHTISLVVALALFCASLSSLVTGLIIPYLFAKIKLDPANASGPIATIIQDILSIIIYFAIATALIQ